MTLTEDEFGYWLIFESSGYCHKTAFFTLGGAVNYATDVLNGIVSPDELVP